MTSYFASQKKARQPVVSRLNVHPPGQSSARGAVRAGQLPAARDLTSRAILFVAVKTMIRRMKASVRKIIKFHEARSF